MTIVVKRMKSRQWGVQELFQQELLDAPLILKGLIIRLMSDSGVTALRVFVYVLFDRSVLIPNS